MSRRSYFSILLFLTVLGLACSNGHAPVAKNNPVQKKDSVIIPAEEEDQNVWSPPNYNDTSVHIADTSLKRKVIELNYVADKYWSMNPIGDVDPYKYVSPQVAHEWLKDRDGTSSKKTKPTVYSLTVIEYYEGLIEGKMRAVLSDEHLPKYDLREIGLTENFGILQSNDGQLTVLTIRQNTSGSAKVSMSYLFYKDRAGKVHHYLDGEDNIAQSGFSSVHTLTSTNGNKQYLLYNWLIGCTTCYTEYMILVEGTEQGLKQVFSCNLQGRGFEEHISFDSATKTIRMEYTTDDMQTECKCYTNDGKHVPGTVTGVDTSGGFEYQNCSCVYVYNGRTFILQKPK